MNPWVAYVGAFTGFGIFLAAWNSEGGKEWRDPQAYWQKELSSAEYWVDFYRKDHAECVEKILGLPLSSRQVVVRIPAPGSMVRRLTSARPIRLNWIYTRRSATQ